MVSNENSTPETSEPIIHPKGNLLSHFDNLNKQMLNLKDLILKDLQVENQRLRNNINKFEKKIS